MYEWTKEQAQAWKKYQHNIETQHYQNTIHRQKYTIEQLQNGLTALQDFNRDKINDQILYEFADRIAENLKPFVERYGKECLPKSRFRLDQRITHTGYVTVASIVVPEFRFNYQK